MGAADIVTGGLSLGKKKKHDVRTDEEVEKFEDKASENRAIEDAAQKARDIAAETRRLRAEARAKALEEKRRIRAAGEQPWNN